MRAFLFILSLVWIASGTIMVLYSDQTRRSLRDLMVGWNFRRWAPVPFIFGLLLVVGAFVVREVFWLAFLLGVLGIAKGAFLAFGPIPLIQKMTDWWFDRASETVLRLSGLVVFTIGVALFSWLL